MTTPRTVCVESSSHRAVATVNGRARCPVFLYDIAAPDKALVTDTFNVTSAKDRARFVGLLNDAHPDLSTLNEIAPLLEQLAAETAAAALKGDTAEPRPNVDVEPWPDVVTGAALLEALSAHIRRYIYLPHEAADAIAAWIVLTHCVEWLTFAPLLVLASASKRCGKTVLLAILKPAVRRARLTSATGITPAVLFRLNERDKPTFLLDEAEKLQGRHADPDLLGLINVGYRRGATAMRCVERSGSFDVQEFDAFGFRALALIGKVWDTVADRAVMIPMQRKPRAVRVARFQESAVEQVGHDFGRQSRRWTSDSLAKLQAAYDEVPRPLWLGDRDCDNWAGLFAVASVAGGDWPERIEAAARFLAGSRDDDGDVGERLVHDTRATFTAEGEPPVISSGELVTKLNAIETSPWGDSRDGRGLSTHALAARFRLFEVKPRAERHPETHAMVRGYWLSDLRAVFERYPAPEPDDRNTATLETIPAAKGTPTATQDYKKAENRLTLSKGGASPAPTVSIVSTLQGDDSKAVVMLDEAV